MGYRVPLVLIQHINEQHPSCTELGTAWPEHHVHFGSLKSHPSSLVASHLLSLPRPIQNPTLKGQKGFQRMSSSLRNHVLGPTTWDNSKIQHKYPVPKLLGVLYLIGGKADVPQLQNSSQDSPGGVQLIF